MLQEEGPALRERLDRSPLQLVLLGLSRGARGQAAARTLVWAEEDCGVEADAELYNLCVRASLTIYIIFIHMLAMACAAGLFFWGGFHGRNSLMACMGFDGFVGVVVIIKHLTCVSF